MNISINLLPALLSVILLELSMSVAAIKPRIARKILMIQDLMTDAGSALKEKNTKLRPVLPLTRLSTLK